MLHLHAALAEQVLRERLEVLAGQPRTAEPGVDVGGRQVFGLHLPERLDIGLEAVVGPDGDLGGPQLLAHVAGEVIVVGFPALGLWVEEN